MYKYIIYTYIYNIYIVYIFVCVNYIFVCTFCLLQIWVYVYIRHYIRIYCVTAIIDYQNYTIFTPV